MPVIFLWKKFHNLKKNLILKEEKLFEFFLQYNISNEKDQKTEILLVQPILKELHLGI